MPTPRGQSLLVSGRKREEETLEYIEHTADLDGWKCPITSQLVAAPLFRVALTPTTTNGLKKPSDLWQPTPEVNHKH